jgi:hypothetical protein
VKVTEQGAIVRPGIVSGSGKTAIPGSSIGLDE